MNIKFETQKGIILDYIETMPNLIDDKDYKGIVIITHGICEYKERYEELTNALNDKGYVVVRYDLRGHGKSDGKRGHIENYLDFVDDLYSIVEYNRKKYSSLKIYLLGHSMGGFIVNLYATKHSNVDGVISMSAPGVLMSNVKLLKFLPIKLVGGFKKKNNFWDKLTSNKIYNLSQKGDINSLKSMDLKLIKEMFIHGVKDLQKNINNIKVPFVYFHGTADKIVDFKSFEYLTQNNPMCKNKISYNNLGHELFNEPEFKNEVITEIISAIKYLN